MGKALEDRLICKILGVVTFIFMFPYYLAFALSAASLGLLPLGLFACLSDHPGLLSSPAARPYLKILGCWTLVTVVLVIITGIVSEHFCSDEEYEEETVKVTKMPTVKQEAIIAMERLYDLADMIISGDHSRGKEFDQLYARLEQPRYGYSVKRVLALVGLVLGILLFGLCFYAACASLIPGRERAVMMLGVLGPGTMIAFSIMVLTDRPESSDEQQKGHLL